MKCKAGDLAIIISNRFSTNIGAFVRLRKVTTVHPELGAFWAFEKASRPLILGGVGDERFDYISAVETTDSNLANLRDVDLQPIRGPEFANSHQEGRSNLMKDWMK